MAVSKKKTKAGIRKISPKTIGKKTKTKTVKKRAPEKPARRQAKEPLKEDKKIKRKGAQEEVSKPIVKRMLSKEEVKKVGTILADAQIRQTLIELGGENALAIIRNFYGNYSDEDIAKKLKLKISDVRATLNKLHNEGIVNYMREKDNETGWYSYSWSLNVGRVERWADTQSKKNDLAADGQDYYFCVSCGTTSITNFESALGANFRCERCEKPLELIDETKMGELYDKKR